MPDMRNQCDTATRFTEHKTLQDQNTHPGWGQFSNQEKVKIFYVIAFCCCIVGQMTWQKFDFKVDKPILVNSQNSLLEFTHLSFKVLYPLRRNDLIGLKWNLREKKNKKNKNWPQPKKKKKSQKFKAMKRQVWIFSSESWYNTGMSYVWKDVSAHIACEYRIKLDLNIIRTQS